MSLPIIGLALGVAGSLVQGMMSAKAASLEAKVANEQLKMDMETKKIQAMQDENKRYEEYLRLVAINRVAVATSTGGGSSYSYEQGIAPYNKEVVHRDVATINFNRDMEVGRMKYQIAVNKFNAKVAGTSAMIGGLVDGLSQVGSYMSKPGGLMA